MRHLQREAAALGLRNKYKHVCLILFRNILKFHDSLARLYNRNMLRS